MGGTDAAPLWRVEMKNFVAAFTTEGGIVCKCAPILGRFKGQPERNLIQWAEKAGGKVERIR
jgi:hypothetical protein